MPTTYYENVNGRLRGQVTAGVRTGYLTDALGSVTATVQSAVVLNTYRYKPYGTQLAKTGAGADPRFGWKGAVGYRDGAPCYVRARHYQETLSSWTSSDPVWPSQAVYNYCYGNPVTLFDPTGLTPIILHFKAFIPRRLGAWMPEPGPIVSSLWEYKSDYRDFNEPGTSRMHTIVKIDSCNIGSVATIKNFVAPSTRRVRGFTHEYHGGPAVIHDYVWPFPNQLNCGGPCSSSFKFTSVAAYPFRPLIAPTGVATDNGVIAVSGKNKVTISARVHHSIFPNFEILLERPNGKSALIYAKETTAPNWALVGHWLGIRVWTDISVTLPADVMACCVYCPCCDGECPAW